MIRYDPPFIYEERTSPSVFATTVDGFTPCKKHGSSRKNVSFETVVVTTLKWSGEHAFKYFPKSFNQATTNCNCGDAHTANICGCLYCEHVLFITLTNQPELLKYITKNTPPNTNQPDHSTDNQLNHPSETWMDYSNAVKNKTYPNPNANKFILFEKIMLLINLLTALVNSKTILTQIINSFIPVLSYLNE